MKLLRSFSILLTLALCSTSLLTAQSDNYQMYVVHEDRVKDGMMDKHIEADKALLKAAKEHNMEGMEWLAFQADDNRVMYLTEIDNFAELDKNPFKDLQEKMGEEAFEKLFEPFAETFTKHGDYILNLDKEHSYMPEGMDQSMEGMNYRELVFYHIPPGKMDKAVEMAKAAKKLYEDKDSKAYYRLYRSGFGTMDSYFMVAVSGKDAASVEKMRKENGELLGEEGEKLSSEIQKIFSKREVVTGHVKPEISYMSEN